MAVKTFTTGEVLTAADTNTYLNNGGLVYVTSQTVGTAVASVTVSNCFSSTYDNYKVVWTNGTSSTTNEIRMTLGSANTNYYGNLFFARPNAATPAGVGNDNIGYWQYAGLGTTNGIVSSFDLYMPNLARRTAIWAQIWEFDVGASAIGFYAGFQTSTTQFTSFTLTASGGTFTGGTITVYGYRKA